MDLNGAKKALAAAKTPAPAAALQVKYNGPASWKTIVLPDGSEVPVGSPRGQAILGTAPKAAASATATSASQASFSPAESANRSPLYVPMGTKGERPGKPHPYSLEIKIRKTLLQDWIGQGAKSLQNSDDDPSGERSLAPTSTSIAGIYEYKFWAMMCFGLTLASYFVNIYVAGVFAYLTGHFWSERLVANAWAVEWFKGKMVVHTK